MKSGRSLVDLAQELERQLATKKDMVVPSSLMLYRTSEQGVSSVDIDEQTGVQTYGITELARRQLADKLKIPYAYFERMRTEQPHLLDRNVNTWLQEDDADKRLIRTLDGHVRAVLSDRYRRLDNFDLAENVLPILQRLPEARFESVELTETRMYLKVVTPSVRYEIAPGDVVQAGVVISQFGGRAGHAVGAALGVPTGLQERSHRLGSCAAQDPRRARSRVCRRVRPRVQGRHAARRRHGLLPQGPRRGRSGRLRSDLPPGHREDAEDDGHQAHVVIR